MVGGAETYARSLASGLVAAGHEVTVITDGSRVDRPADELDHGVRVLRLSAFAQRLGAKDKVLWRLMQFSVFDDIAALLGDEPYDIVHANSYETLIQASMLALDVEVPLVASLHEQWPEREPFGVGRCRLAYQHLPVAAYLAGSTYYVDKALTYGADPARVHLVYHGIDVDAFTDDLRVTGRRRLGVPDDRLLLVCAGRLYERKGQTYLLDALPEVVRQVPNLSVVLAGAVSSFEYEAGLRRQIIDLGLDDVVMIREDLVLDDMPMLFAASDLVVQPSLAEGLGLSVIEAMAAARPIVATSVTGIAEVLTSGVDGVLVPARAPGPLAEALVALATDPATGRRYAAAARATAEHRFSRARMVRATCDVYRAAATTRAAS
jgi:glycosyltransferase involved in cell wall biosynthesis